MHGSYNWSENAKGNNETWATALDQDLVKKFADQFIELYSKKSENEYREICFNFQLDF